MNNFIRQYLWLSLYLEIQILSLGFPVEAILTLATDYLFPSLTHQFAAQDFISVNRKNTRYLIFSVSRVLFYFPLMPKGTPRPYYSLCLLPSFLSHLQLNYFYMVRAYDPFLQLCLPLPIFWFFMLGLFTLNINPSRHLLKLQNCLVVT